jgi:hypothetical protein
MKSVTVIMPAKQPLALSHRGAAVHSCSTSAKKASRIGIPTSKTMTCTTVGEITRKSGPKELSQAAKKRKTRTNDQTRNASGQAAAMLDCDHTAEHKCQATSFRVARPAVSRLQAAQMRSTKPPMPAACAAMASGLVKTKASPVASVFHWQVAEKFGHGGLVGGLNSSNRIACVAAALPCPNAATHRSMS